MNSILITEFPELAQLYSEQFDFWGNIEPPQHCFFAAIINKHLFALLYQNTDASALNRFFSFFEQMAISDDSEVRNLLQVTLLEALWDDPIVYKNAVQHMLPETKKINELIGAYLKKSEKN